MLLFQSNSDLRHSTCHKNQISLLGPLLGVYVSLYLVIDTVLKGVKRRQDGAGLNNTFLRSRVVKS
jgi:hypothetical protein